MREILFRGKTIKTGKWVEGLLWKKKYKSNKLFISCFPDEDDNEEVYVVDPETVGQFTGLTDKNGVKIFEGDMVRSISMYDKANMVVIFEDGEFRMVLCEKYKEYIPGCGFYAIRCFDKEVIGNIFDNPELIEGGGSDE